MTNSDRGGWRYSPGRGAALAMLALSACSLDSAGLETLGAPAEAGAGDVNRTPDAARDATRQADARAAADAPGPAPDARAPGVDAAQGRDVGAPGADAGRDSGVDAGLPPRDAGLGIDSCSAYCDVPTTIETVGGPTASCVSGGCAGAPPLTCPAGEAIIGVSGSLISGGGSTAWAKLEATCGTMTVGSPPGLTVSTHLTGSTGSVGQGSATSASGTCPDGSVLVGFSQQVGGSTAVFALTLECKPVTVGYAPPSTYGVGIGSQTAIAAGGSGGSGDTTATASCSGVAAASALLVNLEAVNFGGPTTYMLPRMYGLNCSSLAFP